MKKMFKSLVLSVAAMCFVVSAYAQITTSALSGRVNDAEGPVTGAVIIAVHTPSGSQYYAVSDKSGQYRINNVTPGGPYTVKVENLGYSTSTITDLYAPLAETLIVDVELQEESLALEGVVISADASESGMNIRRSGAGTSISQRTMENIPTVSRSMNDIMAMTPQASTTTSGFAVGGGNYRGSSVTVDGAAFNNAFGIGSNLPAGGSPISLDAIEQMSINITPFDVRQSGFQGGAINAVTKSGSNEFHASAYNYYTSDAVQGKKVGEGTLTAESLNNTIGVTLGGPIIKNKLFFFVNAEYSFDTVPGATYQARPNGTEAWGSKTAYHRPTVAGLDEIKAFVGEHFDGYNPGRYQDYALETPDYRVLARVDWLINDDNRLNVRFSHTHTFGSNSPSSSMSPIGGTDSSFGSVKFNRYSAGRQSDYTMPFESARYFQEQNFTSVSAELNSRLFDGDANNMFRLTWSHQYEPRSYVGSFFPTVDILSDAEVTGSDTSAMYTTVGLDPFTYGNLRDVQTITATDEYTFTRGINNFIIGAQLEWNRAVNGYMQGGAGWFIYDSFDTFKKDVTAPGDDTYPIAFMITHANLDDPTSQTFPSFDYTQASFYAQDEISFSDYFKLTAGLRLEMPFITIPTDNENKEFSQIAAANPTTSFAGLSTADVPGATLSISPRFGFNWDVLRDRSLIVRGGTGIYTGRIPNVWLVSAVGNSNCLQYQYIANDKTGSPKIHFSNDRAEIINSIYKSGKFEKQDLAAPTATTIIAKDLKMPSSWKSSLAVDAKLPGGIKASLEGVYSYNFNEVYATSLGYAKTGTVQLPGEPEPRSLWTSEGVVNSTKGKMNGYYVQNMSGFHGQYFAVTASLSKSFACGLDLMAAYTRSGATSLSDGNGDQVSEFANTYCLNGCNEPVLGNAFYVSPNRLIANASYTIKEGSHTATKLSAFYEGYNIGFISSYSYSRVSYLINNQSGAGSAAQLIYIPTDSEIDAMSFASLNKVKDADGTELLDAKGNNYTEWAVDDGTMKQAYKDFLANDSYTSKHRGEYSKRNGVTAPWLNRLNVRVAQDFNFNVADRKQTLEIGLDIKNVGNLINSEWGVYKQLSSNSILSYQANNPVEGGAKASYYTFTAPVWKNYNNLASTWQMLLSARWFF